MSITQASIVEFNICQDEKTFPPFHYSESEVKSLGKLGLVKNRLNSAAKGLNLKINYIKLPWKRCIAMFQASKVDALLAAIWSKERKDWGVFPKNKKGEMSELWIKFALKGSKLKPKKVTPKNKRKPVKSKKGEVTI